MGGVGKSPMVAHIAAKMRAAGRNPAILTRGYKRRSRGTAVIVPRGATAPIGLTGDEAQIFIRAGDAHVGIGADRFEVGRLMEQQLTPEMFLLDDGFQHRRLSRGRDVVLIDGFDPLGGGVFPLGRLREPMKSLARATTLVITRVEPGQDTAGIERLLRRCNSQAPIFRSRVAPRHWVDASSGAVRELSAAKAGPVIAFCSLGSPRAFWRMLEQLEVKVAFRWEFRDHHHCRPAELERLLEQAMAAGAEMLVTTEKDAMNLPECMAGMVAPRQLLWLKIGVEIEREEEFLRHIL